MEQHKVVTDRHGLIRVPDVRSPRFAEQAHRQSLAVAESPRADEDQAFIDAITEPPR